MKLLLITCLLIPHNIDTKTLCERYILPLLRANNIRLVQVARAGRFEEDGIEILDDSDQPYTLHIEGFYKLSDELLFAGTVPQFAGVHKCALKFKGWQKNSLERTATPLATTRKRPHEYQEANT